MLSPRAVSAIACGLVIPGIAAGTGWVMRTAWRAIEAVGRSQDIEE